MAAACWLKAQAAATGSLPALHCEEDLLRGQTFEAVKGCRIDDKTLRDYSTCRNWVNKLLATADASSGGVQALVGSIIVASTKFGTLSSKQVLVCRVVGNECSRFGRRNLASIAGLVEELRAEAGWHGQALQGGLGLCRQHGRTSRWTNSSRASPGISAFQ